MKNPQVDLVIAPMINMVGFSDFISKFGNNKGVDGSSELMIAHNMLVKSTNNDSSLFPHLNVTFSVIGNRRHVDTLFNDKFEVWYVCHDDDYFILASANLDKLAATCITQLRNTSSQDKRILYGKFFLIIESKFPEVVKNWHKVGLEDGTFSVRPKEGGNR